MRGETRESSARRTCARCGCIDLGQHPAIDRVMVRADGQRYCDYCWGRVNGAPSILEVIEAVDELIAEGKAIGYVDPETGEERLYFYKADAGAQA